MDPTQSNLNPPVLPPEIQLQPVLQLQPVPQTEEHVKDTAMPVFREKTNDKQITILENRGIRIFKCKETHFNIPPMQPQEPADNDFEKEPLRGRNNKDTIKEGSEDDDSSSTEIVDDNYDPNNDSINDYDNILDLGYDDMNHDDKNTKDFNNAIDRLFPNNDK